MIHDLLVGSSVSGVEKETSVSDATLVQVDFVVLFILSLFLSYLLGFYPKRTRSYTT